MRVRGYDVAQTCPAMLPLRSAERVEFARARQRQFYELLPDEIAAGGVAWQKQWRDRGAAEGGSPAYFSPEADVVVGVCLRDDWLLTDETVAKVVALNREHFRSVLASLGRLG